MGRPSKYRSMSKEELLVAMKEKSKKNAAYKWQKSCTLTNAEGERLEAEILPVYHCANVSQLVKKIVNGELIVSLEESDS